MWRTAAGNAKLVGAHGGGEALRPLREIHAERCTGVRWQAVPPAGLVTGLLGGQVECGSSTSAASHSSELCAFTAEDTASVRHSQLPSTGELPSPISSQPAESQ